MQITNWEKLWGLVTRFKINLIDKFHNPTEKKYKNILILTCVLLITSPFYYLNAIRYDFPVGFSGLYALMGELISANNFKLPAFVPYYGPGGMPFSYPPLAFYVMAFVTKIFHIPTFDYLRFAPAIFDQLCIIPLYYLSKVILKTSTKALIAIILISTSSTMFSDQGGSGGMVRALGFFFVLLGLYFIYTGLDRLSLLDMIAGGLCFGLTIITHLHYAEFFVVSTLVFSLRKKKFVQRFLLVGFSGFIGFTFSSPWWIKMVMDFGMKIFLNPINSHGNANFLSGLTDINFFFSKIINVPNSLARSPELVIFWLGLVGLIFVCKSKQWDLPLWLVLVVVIMSENMVFVILIIGFLAANFLGDYLCGFFSKTNITSNRGSISMRIILVLCFIFTSYLINLKSIINIKPSISEQTIDIGKWFIQNTKIDSRYLFIYEDESQGEWFPYLLHRVPSVGHWGAEWVGNYYWQGYISTIEIPNCYLTNEYYCINQIMEKYNLESDYIITLTPSFRNDSKLEKDNNPNLRKLYYNQDYIVWQFQKSN